jgi:hypothetical protein
LPLDERVLKLYGIAEHEMRFPMAARPWAGICAQSGVDMRLGLQDYNEMLGQQEQSTTAEAIRYALGKYDEYKPRTWDNGKDAEEFEAFRETLPDIIEHGVAAVQECFKQANLLQGEYQRWHNVDGLDVPVMLYQDYSGGNEQADLKVSLSLRNPPKKDGTRSWRVPKPKTEPTWAQVRQQSVYWKATGQMPSLLFVTGAGYHIANSQNCELLTETSLERAYSEVVRSWLTFQNLLKASHGSWRTLAGLVEPDFNEIARKHGSTWVDIARQLWR